MTRAERLLDNLVTSVVGVDHKLRLSYMNSAAEMLFAFSRRQIAGLPFAHLAGGSENMIDGMRRCLETQHPYTERELELTVSGQQPITVDCTVSPLTEPFSEPEIQLLIELRQVDQQLRISREEQLIAQQLTSRALIRNLAHEIKNPLGGLRGAAQLLEHELTSPELSEYTQIIIGEADRLRNLVDRMLGPNKPPVLRDVNLHEVLERVRNLVLAESGHGTIAIEQDYDPSIPSLPGDAEQLIQAVLNIVRNAVQALDSDPGFRASGQGKIILRTRVQRQSTIGLKRFKLVARLEIVDNGPGIPEVIKEGIFFPTISGYEQGTGLGLSIAQSIVSQHGGLIECTSRPGATVFSLLLPLRTSKADDSASLR